MPARKGEEAKPDLSGRLSGVKHFFAFPNPVNEIAARLVAAGAVTIGAAYLVTRSPLLLAVLAYGFVARVASGPRFSPLGLLATRVIVPRLPVEPRLVPGPPKRFAQGIGAVLTLGALTAHLLGATGIAFALIGALVVAASLEAFLGFCLGCQVFALLMRAGLVPDDICRECNDIRARIGLPVETAV